MEEMDLESKLLTFLLLKSHPEHNAENITEIPGDDVPEDNV